MKVGSRKTQQPEEERILGVSGSQLRANCSGAAVKLTRVITVVAGDRSQSSPDPSSLSYKMSLRILTGLIRIKRDQFT